jgi:hypothetical protein
MVKTKKSISSKNSTRKNNGIKQSATFNDLTQWYIHCVQNYGFMILAKKHGLQNKLNCYKRELLLLKQALQAKIMNIKDIDSKNDLQIMSNYTSILIEQASNTL